MAAIAACGHVHAQSGTLESVTVRSERQGSFAAETVQVGTFRDQSPLDVPATSNTVTREVIDAQGQRTLYGALRNTAGVTRAQLSGALYDNIAIRGILVENRGNYRLNGALPIVNQMDIPLENKERVEVLKGVSSLYYGLVPPSGMVNFVTKRAGKQAVTALSTSINEHGGADVHADIARRFGGDQSWGLRVNAVAGSEDPGLKPYAGHRGLLSAALDGRLSQRVNLKIDVEHYKKDVTEQAALQLPATATRLPPVPANSTNLGGEWARTRAESTNWLVRTDIDLGGILGAEWTALLEAGKASTRRDRRYSQFELASETAYTTGIGTLRTYYNDGQIYENTNVRAELAGRVRLGSVAHELTFGITRNVREQDTRANPSVTATFGGQNLYAPVPVPYQAPPRGNAATTSRITDKGLYVYDRMLIDEKWQAQAGIRWTDYTSENLVPAAAPYTAKDPATSLALLYRAAPGLSIYGSAIRGLEAGRLVPVGGTTNYSNGGQLLPAAVNRQAEIGFKAEIARALLQVAYFDIERGIEAVGANNSLTVDGRARYKGLEASIGGEVTRQTAVVASAMAMNPKIVRSTTATETGNIPGNTARSTYSLFVEHRLDAVQGLAVNAGWYHTGKRPLNNANRVFIPAVGTLSLGARWQTRMSGWPVTLQANIDNATNKRYYSAADTTGTLVSVGAPRSLRLGAKIEL